MKTIKIGRGSQNDVVINDPVVSTSHAVITVSDFGEVSIEDLGSKNGTYVDGKRVQKTVLSSASTVLLGNHSIDWKQIVLTAKPKPAKVDVTFPSDVVEKKLIGRNPMSQIRYSFDDISDKHAFLCKKSNGEIVLVDNNSTNGTFVNGSRISAPYVLRKGDNIALAGRHPLNWEAVYPPKLAINTPLVAAVAAAVVLIAGIFLAKPWNWFEKEWSDIYAEHKDDVALIYMKSSFAVTVQGKPLSNYLGGITDFDYCYVDAEGEVSPGIAGSSGTGFFISDDGKMLTNRHVVSCENEEENEQLVKRTLQSFLSQNGLGGLAANIDVDFVVFSIGIVQNDTYIDNESSLIPCTVLRVSDNPELDVAIIQTNSKSLPSGSTFVDLSKAVTSEDLELGYEICTIGFPKSFIIGSTSVGLEANNQSGEITQIRGAYEYGHNITIHQGASGSPVYDRRGRFAGIIVSGFLGISQGYNHAVHPDPVLEFVEKKY